MARAKREPARTAEEKRALILEAARAVFAEEGLEGASLRAVAARAGYTPAALYFHFESKEDLYADLLRESLARLGETVDAAAGTAESPGARLKAVAMAFFGFYLENPRDLDLGFYLFRGGMKPAGLGRERDLALNAALESALRPIAEAAKALGSSPRAAKVLMLDCFAHAAGLLLLLHTGRIRLFNVSAATRMEAYLSEKIDRLTGAEG